MAAQSARPNRHQQLDTRQQTMQKECDREQLHKDLTIATSLLRALTS
jgi:hypothetical protein